MPNCPNNQSYPYHCPTENDHYWPTTACPGCPQLPTNTGYFHFQAPPACISLQFLGFLQGSEHQIKLVENDSATSISKCRIHDFLKLILSENFWNPNKKTLEQIAKVKWQNAWCESIGDWLKYFILSHLPLSSSSCLAAWVKLWWWNSSSHWPEPDSKVRCT